MKRRDVLKVLPAAGLGAAAFTRALAALAAEDGAVTAERIRQAEWISGLELDPADRNLMLEEMEDTVEAFRELRAVPLDNSVPPAFRFEALADPPGRFGSAWTRPAGETAANRPSDETDLAFLPVGELAALVRTRQVSSTEITRLYLDRLEALDPVLHCVITRTDDLALEQAAAADREIASGRYRGPLHGIPWGAKDLLAVPGYPTTWGAKPYEGVVRPERAAVVARLEEAGAVLVAKTSVGALAWGDVWYGGKTRNPWNPEQGSSGSSAGSASAVAAGLLGFAIGTETWGSIVSPCTRCGATGLRPTFGRVSRHGAMALSWTMDKIGPIARSVEDCALVFAAIHGADERDEASVDRPFAWPPYRRPEALRVGFLEAEFDADPAEGVEDPDEAAAMREWRQRDREVLDVLRRLGFDLRPVALPSDLPVGPLSIILTAEAATAFDDLTRSGRDDLLVRQKADAWPNVFRVGQMIPAVEYVRANRIRSLLRRAMDDLFRQIDVYVAPTFGGDNLLLTNLTGQPSVVLPNGFRSADGTPTSITFVGRNHGETDLLAVAREYQQATAFHLKRPGLAVGSPGR